MQKHIFEHIWTCSPHLRCMLFFCVGSSPFALYVAFLRWIFPVCVVCHFFALDVTFLRCMLLFCVGFSPSADIMHCRCARFHPPGGLADNNFAICRRPMAQQMAILAFATIPVARLPSGQLPPYFQFEPVWIRFCRLNWPFPFGL